MNPKKPDIKADISPPSSNASLTLMEPLLLSTNSPHRPKLTDLALELGAKSAAFKASLPLAIQGSLATLVRSMNCYYSNLIEGHDTHPIEIERALQGDYSQDLEKRNLQKEAKAHIEVQAWIDQGGLPGPSCTWEALAAIHKRFYELLPEDLLWVEDPQTGVKEGVTPGAFRKLSVRVGNHIAIHPEALPTFMKRFEEIYSPLGKTETLLALAAQHHRLLWIHPFLDGNGRVARLMSHATTLQVLDTGGVWSIARGLARKANEYKSHLANCDLSRRNDLDGRGNLSEEALAEFTEFFLKTCIDQIEFMQKLMQPALLRTRILRWAREEIDLQNLPPQAYQILEAILYRGEISRGEIAEILKVTDRHARRMTVILENKGILISDSPKSAFKLAFPAALAGRWMPGLFPD